MPVKLKGIVLPSSLVYPKLDSFSLFSIMEEVPVTEGLVGSYFLGSKNADPTYNFANPALPLLRVGSPNTTDVRFAKLSRLTGYFNTQLPSYTTQTIIVLGRQQSTSQATPAVFVSNYLKVSATDVTGDSLMKRWGTYNTSNAAFYAQTSATTVDSVQRIDGVAGDEFSVFGGIVSSSAIGAWSMSESMAPWFTSKSVSTRGTTSRPLLIGATYSATEFTDFASVGAVLIYQGDIGTTQMQSVMDWLRNVVGVQAGIWSAPKG